MRCESLVTRNELSLEVVEVSAITAFKRHLVSYLGKAQMDLELVHADGISTNRYIC